MVYAGMKTKKIYTVYQTGSDGHWNDVCSFKSKLAAMGYIEFQKELDRQDQTFYPDRQIGSYKYEETLFRCED